MRCAIGVAAILLAVGLAPSPAAAQTADERPLCTDRPGLGSPACTVSPGRVIAEIGVGDWTLSRDPAQRSDTILIGDAVARFGIAEHAEVSIGWTSFGTARTRDRLTGALDRASGTGDVTIALQRNLMNPDGEGTTIALKPFVTLPTGGAAIGAGDWSAGVVIPAAFDLAEGLALELTGEIDAATDEDRSGRHFAASLVTGLGIDVTDAVGVSLEVQVARDDDPAGATTAALAGLSLAWATSKDSQLDAGINAGLNRAADDLQLYFGFSRRF